MARQDATPLHDWASAAARLNTSERHVQRLWAERKITGTRIGKKIRFTDSDIDAFIERNRVEALN